jgi:predicted enzyme related to lactoylglutathione lyase
MIKRFDRLDIVTTDLPDASRIYENNFGFTVRREGSSDDATIRIGGAEIRLRSGAAGAEVIAASGEGLAAIWLEAADLDAVAVTLQKAGVASAPIRRANDRRVLAVDPKSANMVPLFIFDRKL